MRIALPIGPLATALLRSRQVCLDLRWQREEIGQNQLGEQFQFFGLFFGGLVQFVDRSVSFKANFMGPGLKVLRDLAFFRKFIYPLFKPKHVDISVELLRADIDGAPKHGHGGSVSPVFQAVRSLNECFCSSLGYAVRSNRFFPDRKDSLSNNRDIYPVCIAQISFQIAGRHVDVIYIDNETDRAVTGWAIAKHIPSVYFTRMPSGLSAIEACMARPAVWAIMNEDSHG